MENQMETPNSTTPYWELYDLDIQGHHSFGLFATEELAKRAQTLSGKCYSIKYHPPQPLVGSIDSWLQENQRQMVQRARAKLTAEEFALLTGGFTARN